MRRRAALALPLALVAFATSVAPATADSALRAALSRQLRPAGPRAGAFVVDLRSGRTLFAAGADRRLTPASNEKVYTTGTALLRLGSAGRLRTTVLATVPADPGGVLRGDLYLRGGGDPTFGSAAFVRRSYGTGATAEDLVRGVAGAGITRVEGSVVGDETLFDTARGDPSDGYARSFYVEGQLSGLTFNRGLTDSGDAFQSEPATYAASRFRDALRTAGVQVTGPAREGPTPAAARELAAVVSPTMATLAGLTNQPSDNFFAETLVKDLGARFGGAGTTTAGARVVTTELARYGVRPRVVDGSGLSDVDRTTPRQMARFLTALRRSASGRALYGSLARTCRTGTLAGRTCGTAASGRCRAKTGTLPGVSSLSGYCTARNGHLVAFSILMNGVDVDRARTRQDRMVAALAAYRGR